MTTLTDDEGDPDEETAGEPLVLAGESKFKAPGTFIDFDTEFDLGEDPILSGSDWGFLLQSRLLYYTACVALAILSLALLSFSLFELSQNQSNPSTGSAIHCNANGWYSHRPATVFFVGDVAPLTCTWNTINSVIRIVCSMGGALLALVPFYAILKRRRLVLLACIAMSAIVCTGLFIVLMMDINDVVVSYRWCTGSGSNSHASWLQGVQWAPDGRPKEPPLCDYQLFTAMCFADIGLLLAWLGFTYLLVYVDQKSTKRHNRSEVEQIQYFTTT
jgi:hypothetical protein